MSDSPDKSDLWREIELTVKETLDVSPDFETALASWCGAFVRALDDLERPGSLERVGRIGHIADGVANVRGLSDARFQELLEFPGGVLGMAFNLDRNHIGCVLLGDERGLSAGDPVRLTGRVIGVPVGEELLGRVVDALGRPLDGAGRIREERRDPIEREAPAILERSPVEVQLITGVKAVDALIPIGRGQRELIVGDRATGKTSLAVDAILSQRRSKVICIYVAIGQKISSVKRVVQSLRDNDAMARTIVVSADAEDSPGLQYVAPYAATAMGEYFMRKGEDVFVVYDDLTRHARAYRQISLLLRRPPGREAYPGDIFFIHSRLLERSTHLNDDLDGGSLTAVPIVETQAKDIAAYIPTNLVSITDGQIFLDPDLFSKGEKPPIDIGRSVSRVGGKTQLPALRKLAETLRLDYAQFKELEVFTRFGTSVEEKTREKIERGKRLREILKQPRLDPLTSVEEALILLAVDRNAIDGVPVEDITSFEEALRSATAEVEDDLAGRIASGEKLGDEDWETLASIVKEVAREFNEDAGANERGALPRNEAS